MSISYERIYNLVRQVPEGRVATYGQIARLIGAPHYARQVGYALAALRDGDRVPWQRIINAKGEISSRNEPGHEQLQRILLEEEGIVFDARGRISLPRFQWRQAIDPSDKHMCQIYAARRTAGGPGGNHEQQ